MKDNKKQESNVLFLSTITSIILSLCLLTGFIIVGIMKIRSDKKHNEKWKDYDECGI
ncbi:MAG: hypothetical protein LUG94_03380 [Ruminococcus sp.]|nr:hypothetical protein [Ruminococcus sp.]